MLVLKQVILVAMLDSVHTVRWIKNWQRTDEVEFTLVPSGPHRKPHPELISLMSPNGPIRNIKGRGLFGGLISYALDKFLGTPLQLKSLESAIAETKNSKYYLHYLETQHSGYLALRLLRKQSVPIVVGSNWGSDLYWFKRFNRHRKKIEELLKQTNKYLVECERDYELADELGFEGERTLVGPNSFIYKQRPKIAKDKLILVKGYQGWAGRSHIALRAIAEASGDLRDFRVIVYSCGLRTKLFCGYLSHKTKVKFETFPKHVLSEDDMKKLFSRGQIYVGASITDGVSTSALEALNHGLIVIQTNSACLGNLIDEGNNGFTPSPNVIEIRDALVKSIALAEDTVFRQTQSSEILMQYGSARLARKRFSFAYDLSSEQQEPLS